MRISLDIKRVKIIQGLITISVDHSGEREREIWIVWGVEEKRQLGGVYGNWMGSGVEEHVTINNSVEIIIMGMLLWTGMANILIRFFIFICFGH